MRSGLRALAALCSIALSVNTGCTKDPLRSNEVTQENDSAVRAETADASAESPPSGRKLRTLRRFRTCTP